MVDGCVCVCVVCLQCKRTRKITIGLNGENNIESAKKRNCSIWTRIYTGIHKKCALISGSFSLSATCFMHALTKTFVVYKYFYRLKCLKTKKKLFAYMLLLRDARDWSLARNRIYRITSGKSSVEKWFWCWLFCFFVFSFNEIWWNQR